MVLDVDLERDMHSLCLFRFGRAHEAFECIYLESDDQSGARLRNSVSSSDFWRKGKNDTAVLLGDADHPDLSTYLSGDKLLE